MYLFEKEGFLTGGLYVPQSISTHVNKSFKEAHTCQEKM